MTDDDPGDKVTGCWQGRLSALGNFILGTLKMGCVLLTLDKSMGWTTGLGIVIGWVGHCLTGRNILRLEAPLIRMIFWCETMFSDLTSMLFVNTRSSSRLLVRLVLLSPSCFPQAASPSSTKEGDL